MHCRRNAWDRVDYREHHVLRVYTLDPSCRDILLLCQSINSMGGESVLFDFTCRVVFDDPAAVSPKLKLAQTWAVGSLLNSSFFLPRVVPVLP